MHCDWALTGVRAQRRLDFVGIRFAGAQDIG